MILYLKIIKSFEFNIFPDPSWSLISVIMVIRVSMKVDDEKPRNSRKFRTQNEARLLMVFLSFTTSKITTQNTKFRPFFRKFSLIRIRRQVVLERRKATRNSRIFTTFFCVSASRKGAVLTGFWGENDSSWEK